MKIRQATRGDLNTVIELLREYSAESPLRVLATNVDEGYVRSLITGILVGGGVIWLSELDGVSTGMLIAMRVPNVWNPHILLMQELAYWIKQEYRGSWAGFRLFKAYCDYSETLLKNGEIHGYTASRWCGTQFNLERRGLKKLEETYWKGQSCQEH